MMYSLSPASPSENRRSPRSRRTSITAARSAPASSSLSDSNSGVSLRTSSALAMTPPRVLPSSGARSGTLSPRMRFGQPGPAREDLVLGGADAHPGGCFDFLARLERLIDLEEMLDLKLIEGGDVADIPEVRHPGIGSCDAQHLVVGTLLIPHPEHADSPAPDQAAREGRLVQKHQGV